MANVIIKTDERKAHEAQVLKDFQKNGSGITSGDREAAEYIAARSSEAYAELKRMEKKRQ